MTQPPPARPGDVLSAVDTPALLIDLDAFERNLDAMARFCAAAGVGLRPHAKTHKSPVIARMQMARGAVGVCVQKVSEAAAMADGGVDDILISNQVVGAQKLARVAALARRARVTICVDDAGNVADLAAAAACFGAEIGVLVEIDVGQNRCGVAPGAAAARLARTVAAAPGLSFRGLQAYNGAVQQLRDPAERQGAVARSADAVRETLAALAAEGLTAETIGGAGTGTFPFEAAAGLWTELQPGSYIFMDADYARNAAAPGAPGFEKALFVWTTVMSRRAGGAVVDAGHKAAAVDSGPPVPLTAGLVYGGPSDEHGQLTAEGGAALPALGQKLALIPGHCDPTVNLHDWFIGVRGLRPALAAGDDSAYVETVWPVAARGAGF